MYNLPSIQPLPEIQRISPTRAMQEGRERRMAEDYARQRMELTSMQLNEYKAGAPRREQEQKLAALQNNAQISSYIQESLAYIDPKSPSFDQQMSVALQGLRSEIIHAGFNETDADMYIKAVSDKGLTTRGGVAVLQKRLGITEEADKPKLHEASGQQFTYNEETGEYEAKPVKGFQKEESTPTTAMAAFLKQKPDATPEELVAFSQQLKGKGMRVTLPDGTVMEVGGGADMTVKTKGAVEEKIVSGKEQLARISTIKSEFKPEFQEVGARLANAWTGLKAKFGQDVSEEDAAKLTEFKQYQRKSIENINLYIKELTGAQMSEKEADRLRLAQPDPGEKFYQGDDPITFKAKLNDVEKYTRAAIARYEYYKNKGLSDKQIQDMVNEGAVVPLESLVSKME